MKGDGTGLFKYILKVFMLKNSKEQSGKKIIIPVNEPEGEIL